MNVVLVKDEWYPVWGYQLPRPIDGDRFVDVPDEVIKAYDGAQEAFLNAEEVLKQYRPERV